MPNTSVVQAPFPHVGLVTQVDADEMPPEALATATNVYYPSPSTLRSRGGFARYQRSSAAGGNTTIMYIWPRDSNLYFADDAAKLYKQGGSGTASTISGTSQNVSDMVSFGVSDTPTLIVAERIGAQNHTLHTYDGTTYATLTGTSVPNVEKLMVWKARLLGTGNASFPSRIYWCKVNDSTVWSGAWNEGGQIDVAPGQDGKIVDWIYHKGIIYVFKETAVYYITGEDVSGWRVYPLVKTISAIQPNTVANSGLRGVVYGTRRGVYVLGQENQAEIYNLIESCQSDISGILDGAKGIYSEELGAYLVSSGTTTLWVSNHNNRPDVWTKFIAPAAVTSMYNLSTIYLGGKWTSGGVDYAAVYQYNHTGFQDTYTTAASYPVTFKTGNWDFGDKRHRKQVRYFGGRLSARHNATVTLGLYPDRTPVPVQIDTIRSNDRQLIRTNFNCERAAVELTYTEMKAPVMFAGAFWEIAPAAEIM